MFTSPIDYNKVGRTECKNTEQKRTEKNRKEQKRT